MVRPSGEQLLIKECCARRAYRVMWHNCFSRCSRSIGMKKLSYKHMCKLACRAHVSTLFTGHKQRFIHNHVTRSPPIGIAKLSEVFRNLFLSPKVLIWEVLLLVRHHRLSVAFRDYFSAWTYALRMFGDSFNFQLSIYSRHLQVSLKTMYKLYIVFIDTCKWWLSTVGYQ